MVSTLAFIEKLVRLDGSKFGHGSQHFYWNEKINARNLIRSL